MRVYVFKIDLEAAQEKFKDNNIKIKTIEEYEELIKNIIIKNTKKELLNQKNTMVDDIALVTSATLNHYFENIFN